MARCQLSHTVINKLSVSLRHKHVKVMPHRRTERRQTSSTEMVTSPLVDPLTILLIKEVTNNRGCSPISHQT